MDPDMNKYDLEHVVADHAKMTQQEWDAIYREAWDAYYTPEHMRTILRRAAASGMGMSRLLSVLFFFSTCFQVEGVHPLQGGVFRLKYRRDRRSTLSIEPVWSFYPKYLWEIVSKHARIARHWFWLDRVRKRVKQEQRVSPYTDLALTAVTDRIVRPVYPQ
jgi:hypothetical protein